MTIPHDKLDNYLDIYRDHPCFRIPQGDQLIMLEDPGVAVKDLYTQAWESVKQS